MKAIETITGRVSVLNRDDVDTDQIIPKQFLKRVERTGFGEFLFYDWAKEDGWDLPVNPILATGPNFGCGSSREHAAWALEDRGFRVVLAPSFGDIFHTNAIKSGLAPIELPEEALGAIRDAVAARNELTVDLEAREVSHPGGLRLPFLFDDYARETLLHGLDDVARTLKREDRIAAYEASLAPRFDTRLLA